jgi:ABC-type spermidine/putrescine transport system permease subunit I
VTARGALAPWALAAPAVALLAVGFVAPLVVLARVSLFESAPGGTGFYRPDTLSFAAYAELLGDPFGRNILFFTVALGCAVAALAVLLGYPLALFVRSLPPRARALALAAVVLPKLTNVFVVLYGVNLLLGSAGPVNRVLVGCGLASEPVLLTHNLFGVLVAETYLILPYAVLVLVPALDRIDPQLVAAARGLGAGPGRAFLRVTLPLSLPGVALAGLLCLVWALGAFVGPLLLGGPDQATLAVRVQKDALESGNWPRGAATAVLSLLTVAACAALYSGPARVLKRIGGARDA